VSKFALCGRVIPSYPPRVAGPGNWTYVKISLEKAKLYLYVLFDLCGEKRVGS